MRRVWAIAAFTLLGLAFLMTTLGMGTMRASTERTQAEHWRVHTLQVINTAERLGSSVRDIQRAQRGYLLTNDATYANSFGQGIRGTKALLTELRRMTADNARQQDNIAGLSTEVDAFARELMLSIDAANAGDRAKAVRIIRTGEGPERMRAIQIRLDRIMDEESRLLRLRATTADTADTKVQSLTTWLTVLGAIFLAGGALLGAVAIQRHTRQAEIDALMRSVLRSIDGAVFVKDSGGRYTLMSEVGAKLFARPVSAIIGHTDAELRPPLFAAQVAEHDAKVIEHGAPLSFDEVVEVDGQTMLLSTTRTPLHSLDGHIIGIAGVALNVTARREAEAALMRAKAEGAAVFELAAIGIAQADPETRKLIKVNARLAEITGYTTAELIGGMTVDQLNHPDDLEADVAGFQRLLAGESQYRIDKRYVRKDGSTTWVRANVTLARAPDGGPLRTVAMVEEIGAQKRAEDELYKTSAMLRAVIEAVPGLIYAKDRGGRMILANGPALDLIGKPWEDVQGRTDVEFLNDPDQGRAIMANDRGVMEANAIQTLEERVALPDGMPRVWLSTKAPLNDPSGMVVGLVGVSVDITARKEAEGELLLFNETLTVKVAEAVGAREEALAQLHEAQKLETIGQLTGGVAHDFNNLLTPIVGGLELLQRRVPQDDAKSQRLIGGALQSAERARVLVARLLSFARRQKLEPKVVDLGNLVAGLDDLIRRSVGPTIQVATIVPEALPPAFVDPNQLEMALLNLAVNARDAMPDGGELTIETAVVDVPPYFAPQLSSGQYLRLSVRDTGTGMDEATRRRAIEPFYSTKEQGKGTGLGLSMAHGLAAQSGGLLTIDSTLGQGTRIAMLFPASIDKTVTALAERREQIATTRPLNVLVVDDEELVRQGTADALTELGHTVVQANSGAQALAMLNSGINCDFLLSDYLMPGMSGVEVVAEARKLRADLPVLIVTGFANMAEAAHRDVPWIAKPFRLSDLASKMAALTD